jgi:hypothetical protein
MEIKRGDLVFGDRLGEDYLFAVTLSIGGYPEHVGNTLPKDLVILGSFAIVQIPP